MLMISISSVMVMFVRVLDQRQRKNGEVEVFCLDIIQD